MKRTITTLLVMFFVQTLFCQNPESRIQNPESNYEGILVLKQETEGQTEIDFCDARPVPAYEMAYFRYCMNKFNAEASDGIFFLAAGVAGVAIGEALNGDEQKIIKTVGYAVSAYGGFKIYQSGHWLKQASIKPTRNGLGFVIQF